jgi:hypothetical protein
MAEEEEASGSGWSGEGVGQRSNPENGLTGAAVALQEKAAKVLEENLGKVVDCILDNILAKHLPSAKLLMELAGRVKGPNGVPEEEYMSLAAVLWKACQEQGYEPGRVDEELPG